MAQQIINVGTVANDGTGDPLRTGMQKVNANFTELYALIASGGGGGGGGPIIDTVTTLDLSGPTLPAGIALTRGSSATYFDVTGAIQQVGNDVPRFDYDPSTHRYLGLLSEPAATNLLLNSKLDGTNLSTQTVTVVSGVYYCLNFIGSGTVTLSGAYSYTMVGATASNERTLAAFQTSGTSLTVTVSGTVKWAQLERGNFPSPPFGPTSFIPTAGAPASRAEDVIIFTGAAFAAVGASQGSAIVTCVSKTGYVGPLPIIASDATGGLLLNQFDTSNGNNVSLTASGGGLILESNLSLYLPDWSAQIGLVQKVGVTWQSGNNAISVNGYPAIINTNATTIAAASTVVYLGSYGPGQGYFNGWFQHIELHTKPQSGSILQGLCALPAPVMNTGTPQGALDLGYATQAYSLLPALSDIAPDQTAGTHALYDGVYFNTSAPQSTYYLTGGVVTMDLGTNGLCTQTRNSVAGSLGYLNGANGFYAEFTVALTNNNIDHWPAVWFMPWEHNLAGTDHYPNPPYSDPSGYERWMELDVDEGGFTKHITASMIDWQGKWDSASGAYWRDPPTNSVPGNVVTNFQAASWFDRTQYHTFGASYDPIKKLGRWYLDDVLVFQAKAPSVANLQHFYQLITPQSHGSNTMYSMLLKRIRAYTP